MYKKAYEEGRYDWVHVLDVGERKIISENWDISLYE
ncbi:MAG: hypothetical protein Satyrvirus8_20 [Satyrvirus sp.]|uniref:Uncharacterized protein n=1 Tax=Satyrvirus sp. TaxID=2487771 RepID=A0A3G5ADK6_9VIRU|nr:MAG: hypothetical protein Satyrvirus8_20 [Satyrvirus sp.]